MLKTPTLSDAEVKSFNEDGFVILRGGFDEADAALLQRWTTELAARPEEPGKHWVYHETSLRGDGLDLINRIENMTPFHDGFAALAENLRPSVGQLLGEEAVLFKDKINFKMPGGDGFKPHQDSQAGWDTYTEYYITVMVCIDNATIENGCLEIARGGGKSLVGKSWEPLTEKETAGMEFVPCPTAPGDIIYFDCYVPHSSEPNLTDKTRRMYFGTYNRLSDGDHLAQYFADKHANYPPDIEREADKEYVYRV